MEFSKTFYSSLLDLSLKARSLRAVFDRFWREDPTRRLAARHAYFIRHVSLLNAFDDFLFLFCSRELWTAGGTGAWACCCTESKAVGPLQVLSNGDQIDKIIMLLMEQKAAVLEIIQLYQSEVEKAHLLYALEHISKLQAILSDCFIEIEI